MLEPSLEPVARNPKLYKFYTAVILIVISESQRSNALKP